MNEAQFQLNLTFVPVEDRLLLRIASGTRGSMAEYRLLLTRRFVKILWSALERVLQLHVLDPCIAPEGRNAVIQFQQSAALSQTDFSTPYLSEQALTPFGQHPLLIHKLQARKGTDDAHVISFEAVTGQTVSMICSVQIIYSFRKLLADMVLEAGWDLPCSLVPEEDATGIPDTLGSIN